jgi:hypothetical protein
VKDAPVSAADELAEALVGAGVGTVRSILLYGSHMLGANPDRHSAVDFIVIVDEYRPFYGALNTAGELHRPAGLLSMMASVLPPNVIAFAPEHVHDGIAKCIIVSRAHLEQGLGRNPPDHFLLGRLVQKVGPIYTATPNDAEWVDRLLASARDGVLQWLEPYLDGPIDAEGLGRRMLEVCYQGELRPESTQRAHRIFEAQASHFRKHFAPVLIRGVEEGMLVELDDEKPHAGTLPRYELARPASPASCRRWHLHFRKSKLRATARWFKYIVTFANWLPYVVRKVERHRGERIELTRLERRLPLLFLWPRAIKVLLTRPSKELPR